MTRILRCAACTRRIRGSHAHVGLSDVQSGREICYHAHPSCQRRGAEEMASLLERGRVYILRHYHVCGDEQSGFDCSGGCFSGASEAGPEAVAN